VEDERIGEVLARLDRAQREAVTTDAAPLAIVAGAGSGKTGVLTRRIAYRVLTGRASAPHVLAITFTRQAASELASRLRGLGLRESVATGTFHAVALDLVRLRAEDAGRRPPSLCADPARLLQELGTDRAAAVASEISWARARLVSPESYGSAARRAGRRPPVPLTRFTDAFARYTAEKSRRRLVDFDDLLERATRDLERDTAYRDAVHWRYRHLFVDEFQDVNPLQHRFLAALRGDRADLTVVGDPAQAVYGWNGADPALLERVEETVPGITILRLDTNYRCSEPVLAAAGSVLVADGQARTSVHATHGGPPVRFVAVTDERAEAVTVADLVRELRLPGRPWSSVAVLARTHAQLDPLVAALARAGVPARLGADRHAAELASVRARLRELGPDELRAWALDVLADTGDDTDAGPVAREWALAAREFTERGEGSGQRFLAWLALRELDVPGEDAVGLATFHAAKGREWDAVVVVGAETGLVPHRSAVTPEQRAEEARLLYVALTRARDRLAVVWAEERGGERSGRTPLLDTAAGAAGGDATTETVGPEAGPGGAGGGRAAGGARPPDGHTPPDPALVALRAWRRSAARAANVVDELVLDDATLAAVARARPTTPEELAEVPGVSRPAARRFATRILAVLDQLP
jgi:DNA helicase-2/ATP-dependent DNA helicase PcrA